MGTMNNKRLAMKIIVAEIMNMWENDIILENGTESFIGWCEDGDIFADLEETHKEKYDEVIKLMNEVAPLVDKLTYDYFFNPFYNEMA